MQQTAMTFGTALGEVIAMYTNNNTQINVIAMPTFDSPSLAL